MLKNAYSLTKNEIEFFRKLNEKEINKHILDSVNNLGVLYHKYLDTKNVRILKEIEEYKKARFFNAFKQDEVLFTYQTKNKLENINIMTLLNMEKMKSFGNKTVELTKITMSVRQLYITKAEIFLLKYNSKYKEDTCYVCNSKIENNSHACKIKNNYLAHINCATINQLDFITIDKISSKEFYAFIQKNTYQTPQIAISNMRKRK